MLIQADRLLFTVFHILQHRLAGGQLIIAQNQAELGTDFIGILHLPLQGTVIQVAGSRNAAPVQFIDQLKRGN